MHNVGETVLQDGARALWEAAFLFQKVFFVDNCELECMYA